MEILKTKDLDTIRRLILGMGIPRENLDEAIKTLLREYSYKVNDTFTFVRRNAKGPSVFFLILNPLFAKNIQIIPQQRV